MLSHHGKRRAALATTHPHRRFPMGHGDEGFTLIELIVCIAILGIIIIPLATALALSLQSTNAIQSTLTASASRDRLDSFFTGDVASVNASGVSTSQSTACEYPTGSTTASQTAAGLPRGDDGSTGTLLVSFDSTSPTNNTAINRASYWVVGNGVDIDVLRLYCRSITQQSGTDVANNGTSTLLADSVGSLNELQANAVVGSVSNPSPTGQTVCNVYSCQITVTGSYTYTISAQRRVFGLGVPLQIGRIYSSQGAHGTSSTFGSNPLGGAYIAGDGSGLVATPGTTYQLHDITGANTVVESNWALDAPTYATDGHGNPSPNPQNPTVLVSQVTNASNNCLDAGDNSTQPANPAEPGQINIKNSIFEGETGMLSLGPGLDTSATMQVYIKVFQTLQTATTSAAYLTQTAWNDGSPKPFQSTAPEWIPMVYQCGTWRLPLATSQFRFGGQYTVWTAFGPPVTKAFPSKIPDSTNTVNGTTAPNLSGVGGGGAATQAFGGTLGFPFWIDWKPGDSVFVDNTGGTGSDANTGLATVDPNTGITTISPKATLQGSTVCVGSPVVCTSYPGALAVANGLNGGAQYPQVLMAGNGVTQPVSNYQPSVPNSNPGALLSFSDSPRYLTVEGGFAHTFWLRGPPLGAGATSQDLGPAVPQGGTMSANETFNALATPTFFATELVGNGAPALEAESATGDIVRQLVMDSGPSTSGVGSTTTPPHPSAKNSTYAVVVGNGSSVSFENDTIIAEAATSGSPGPAAGVALTGIPAYSAPGVACPGSQGASYNSNNNVNPGPASGGSTGSVSKPADPLGCISSDVGPSGGNRDGGYGGGGGTVGATYANGGNQGGTGGGGYNAGGGGGGGGFCSSAAGGNPGTGANGSSTGGATVADSTANLGFPDFAGVGAPLLTNSPYYIEAGSGTSGDGGAGSGGGGANTCFLVAQYVGGQGASGGQGGRGGAGGYGGQAGGSAFGLMLLSSLGGGSVSIRNTTIKAGAGGSGGNGSLGQDGGWGGAGGAGNSQSAGGNTSGAGGGGGGSGGAGGAAGSAGGSYSVYSVSCSNPPNCGFTDLNSATGNLTAGAPGAVGTAGTEQITNPNGNGQSIAVGSSPGLAGPGGPGAQQSITYFFFFTVSYNTASGPTGGEGQYGVAGQAGMLSPFYTGPSSISPFAPSIFSSTFGGECNGLVFTSSNGYTCNQLN